MLCSRIPEMNGRFAQLHHELRAAPDTSLTEDRNLSVLFNAFFRPDHAEADAVQKKTGTRLGSFQLSTGHV